MRAAEPRSKKLDIKSEISVRRAYGDEPLENERQVSLDTLRRIRSVIGSLADPPALEAAMYRTFVTLIVHLSLANF